MGHGNAQGSHYEAIDALMKISHDRGLFNGSVLVSSQGHVVYENELGFTDGSKTTKLSSDSFYSLGSIGKEFHGVSIMILQERGLLNIDDTLDKFNLDLPDWSKTVTIRNLLTYTSGLPRVNWGTIRNNADILNDIKSVEQ